MATIPQEFASKWAVPIARGSAKRHAVVDVRLRDGTELNRLVADESGYLYARIAPYPVEFETCGFDFGSEDIVALRPHRSLLSRLGLNRWRRTE